MCAPVSRDATPSQNRQHDLGKGPDGVLEHEISIGYLALAHANSDRVVKIIDRGELVDASTGQKPGADRQQQWHDTRQPDDSRQADISCASSRIFPIFRVSVETAFPLDGCALAWPSHQILRGGNPCLQAWEGAAPPWVKVKKKQAGTVSF